MEPVVGVLILKIGAASPHLLGKLGDILEVQR
jgi:hypothetical protein